MLSFQNPLKSIDQLKALEIYRFGFSFWVFFSLALLFTVPLPLVWFLRQFGAGGLSSHWMVASFLAFPIGLLLLYIAVRLLGVVFEVDGSGIRRLDTRKPQQLNWRSLGSIWTSMSGTVLSSSSKQSALEIPTFAPARKQLEAYAWDAVLLNDLDRMSRRADRVKKNWRIFRWAEAVQSIAVVGLFFAVITLGGGQPVNDGVTVIAVMLVVCWLFFLRGEWWQVWVDKSGITIFGWPRISHIRWDQIDDVVMYSYWQTSARNYTPCMSVKLASGKVVSISLDSLPEFDIFLLTCRKSGKLDRLKLKEGSLITAENREQIITNLQSVPGSD